LCSTDYCRFKLIQYYFPHLQAEFPAHNQIRRREVVTNDHTNMDFRQVYCLCGLNNIQYNSTYPDAGYPDRLGDSGKHFLTVIALHLYMAVFPPIVKYMQGIEY
jgi:hypothetical protein